MRYTHDEGGYGGVRIVWVPIEWIVEGGLVWLVPPGNGWYGIKVVGYSIYSKMSSSFISRETDNRGKRVVKRGLCFASQQTARATTSQNNKVLTLLLFC
jgi:hypothetical protein